MLAHNLAFYISAFAAFVSVCLSVQGIAQTQATGRLVILAECDQYTILLPIMVSEFILGLVFLALGF